MFSSPKICIFLNYLITKVSRCTYKLTRQIPHTVIRNPIAPETVARDGGEVGGAGEGVVGEVEGEEGRREQGEATEGGGGGEAAVRQL